MICSCDICVHLISYLEIESSKLDFKCPICGNSFKNFNPDSVYAEKED